VVSPAGAQLGLHHHPGTQVAYVASGELTYSVKSGSVAVMKGAAVPGAAKLMRRIGPGQRGVIHAGEWIVEQPSTIHSGANKTGKPVVVYLATLFPVGSPAAIANG
jgi:quercetin dioxygenase-like cupin family protein